jgi:hypothetical protein
MRMFAVVTAALGLAALAVGVPSAGALQRSASATYSCTATVPISGGKTVRYTNRMAVSAVAPKSVAPGSKVSLTSVQYKVTIPASVVNQVIKISKKVSADVTTLDIVSTNKPATLNAAGKGILISPINLVPNGTVILLVPSPSTTAGPWTAGTAGTMAFSTGKVNLTLTAAGKKVPVICTPKPAVVLGTTTVS